MLGIMKTWMIGVAGVVLSTMADVPIHAAARASDIVSISLGSDVTTMDPHTTSSAITNTIHRYVFDTLTHRPKGAIEPIPWAAKSIELVDPRTYEFRMREGVKFTNGEDVDAEAVRFSLLRPRQPGFRSAQSEIFRNIVSVEIVSKWVARVHLDAPDPGLLNRLSDYGNLVPPKYYASISQEDAAVHPIGGGPYRLVRWVKDVEMVFEVNPDYWNKDLAAIKTVRIVPVREDGTKVAALLAGEINLVNQLPSQYIARVKNDPRTKVESAKGTRIFHLGFTHAIKSPLSDMRVRRAIAYAIDRSVLVKDVAEGYGAVANTPLHEWTEGFDANQSWPYPYDPAKAKALVAEAGYPNGFDITFYGTAGRYTKDKEMGEAIAGFLQAVGIRANYQPLTWSRYVEVFKGRGQPDGKPFLYYIGYGNGNGDTDATLLAIAGCKGVWSAYCDAGVDKELNVALGSVDRSERDRIFRRIVTKLTNDVAQVFLWQEDAVYGMSKDVQWDIRNDDRVYAWEVRRRP
jgi:peptide/nickel transport system substrate-binding protein